MRTGRHTNSGRDRADDTGFTLVELLIVIVILGILATVTVFAVRGITDSGQENAEATDLRAIQQASEAYTAQNGTNPTEQQLVDGGYMSELSQLHDVTVDGAGTMTITNVRTGAVAESIGTPPSGGGGGAPEPANVTQAHVFAGFDALRYGQGAKTLVFLGSGNPGVQVHFESWVAANPPIADTQFILVNDPELDTLAEVEVAISAGATAFMAEYTFTHRWEGAIPFWYINGGGVGAFGPLRSPGVGNAIQFTYFPGTNDFPNGIAFYEANY